jgi:hypothetical protein
MENKKSDSLKSTTTNVIQLSERIANPEISERLKNLKLRFDLEHARVALPVSLLSIVLLVTIANSNFMSTANNIKTQSVEFASTNSNANTSKVESGRAIASLSTGTSADEDQLVTRLAKTELSSETSVTGRKPSALEKLTLGTLEGKYAVRLLNGKVHEIEFAASQLPKNTASNLTSGRPKYLSSTKEFLINNGDLFSDEFESTVRVSRAKNGKNLTETYQLLNKLSLPVAKVDFYMDQAGRLLKVKVSPVQSAQ